MMSTNKFSSKTKLFLLGCLLVLAACAVPSLFHNTGNSEPVIHKFSADGDRYVASNIAGLVKNSDYVFIGRFNSLEDKWVMRTEPFYKEGDLYNFKVEEALYGDAPDTAQVGIPHFERLSTTVDGQTYTSDVTEPHYVKPTLEQQQYILFLKKYKDIYVPAAAPFILEVDSNNKVNLKYNKEGAVNKVKISNKEYVEFSGDDLNELNLNDAITGKNYNDIVEQIKSEAAKKK